MSTSGKHKEVSHSKNEMKKYEVLKLLGEGSFGRVFKAKVIADSSFVALKVICKTRKSNKEIVCLRRECEIQRNLHHPNIIQMLDSFETASQIVVVTEFAQKELNTLLGKEGYLSEERAGPIIWDLVSALNYLHSHRVLHRDLKPQNILIDSKNRAKLCDFGFARNMSTGTHVLTSIKGTPLYMAPELVEEQPYDYKADLWSLGCVMYELLVGAPPFCTASILHLIRLIRHEQIQWPTFVSETCITFLKGLLQKDPAKRIGWEQILNHGFVKGHILICDDSTNMPLTRPMSARTLHAKELQRRERLGSKADGRSLGLQSEEQSNSRSTIEAENVSLSQTNDTRNDSQDSKNNNASLQTQLHNLSLESDLHSSLAKNETKTKHFIEENHPIETEEWIDFLQKSMEEVLCGDVASLTQPYLTNIIVSPLRNTNTNSKVLSYVTKKLSMPFALKGISLETKELIKKVYLEVKLVPNLIYSSKQIMKVRNEDSSTLSPSISMSPVTSGEIFKDLNDLTDEDFHSLEHIYMLITHLVYLDNEFLSHLCDSVVVLNVFPILRSLLLIGKSREKITMDLLAILTHVLRVFPENVELIEKILLDGEGKTLNFIDLLRFNNATVQERTCHFLLHLGKCLTTNKMESLWNETVRESLEALMYDSNENVRNAADRAVDELKYKEFYKNK